MLKLLCYVAFPAALLWGAAPTCGAADPTALLTAILEDGVSSGVYPGAVAMAGRGSEILYAQAVGRHSYSGDEGESRRPMTLDTVFDVASLSKVLATTSAVAWLYERGLVDLDSRVTEYLGDGYAAGGKQGVTLRHCMLHTSGLSPDPDPWYWAEAFGCPNTAHEQPEEDFSCLATAIYQSLLDETVQSSPGETYVYSDLGFISLSFVVGTVALSEGLVGPEMFLPACAAPKYGGQEAVQKICAFEAFVRTRVFQRATESGAVWMPHTRYLPPEPDWPSCAPTLNDTGDGSYTHRRLQGQVADGDCYAMGGIAGHAGVFSTAGDVGTFLSYMLAVRNGQTKDGFLNASTVTYFTSIYNSSQSSRGLGWSTNSFAVEDFGYDHSCGSMHANTFMHTGYTGTCMCADPISGLWSVILTTRIYNCQGQLCPTGSSDAVKSVYRTFNSELNARFGTATATEHLTSSN